MTWTPKEIRNSADKQRHLVTAVQLKGDKFALEQIVEAMTPYVLAAVSSIGINSPEDREDLVMEGHLAVIEAIDMYDPTREARFSTYAFYRIRMAVSQWLAKNVGTIPMPYEAWRVARLVDGHEQDAGRELTTTELKELTGKGYARKAADARQQYIQIDHFDDHRLYQEESNLDQVVVEFVLDLAEMETRMDRGLAAEEFCAEYDLEPGAAQRMVEMAEEVIYEVGFGPGSDHGRGVANRQRRSKKPGNRRR